MGYNYKVSCENQTRNAGDIKHPSTMGTLIANIFYHWRDSWIFVSGPVDRGSIIGRIISKTQKMVLNAFLFNTQNHKVRIKGKWSNPVKGVAFSSIPRYNEKGAFESPWTPLDQLIYVCVCGEKVDFGESDKMIKVKLVTVAEGDSRAPFSIATTPRCSGRRYSFPWIAPLYP